MTLRALVGLFALNGGYLVVGSCLLWALRGWGSWREWARFAGLSYLLGIASLGILWTLMLVVGVPVRALALLVSAVVLAAAAVAIGRARGHRWPGRSGPLVLTKLSLVSAAGIASDGRLLRGAVPSRSAAGPLRVRRLGLLDPEGEADPRPG